MATHRWAMALAVVSLSSSMALAVPPTEKERDELGAMAAVIKPTEKELTWLKIPWVLNLKEAQTVAKTERRPIFLWVTGDEPLGRC